MAARSFSRQSSFSEDDVSPKVRINVKCFSFSVFDEPCLLGERSPAQTTINQLAELATSEPMPCIEGCLVMDWQDSISRLIVLLVPGLGQESLHTAQFVLLSIMTHVHHRLVVPFQACKQQV